MNLQHPYRAAQDTPTKYQETPSATAKMAVAITIVLTAIAIAMYYCGIIRVLNLMLYFFTLVFGFCAVLALVLLI